VTTGQVFGGQWLPIRHTRLNIVAMSGMNRMHNEFSLSDSGFSRY